MQQSATNKLLIAALVMAGLGLETGYGWGGGNRLYRREITLSPATTSVNYQVLVTLATTNFNYTHATTNGGDLLFTDTSDGELKHWIENWNTNGESKIWVRVVPINTSTIRLYYGDQNANMITMASNVFMRVIGDESQSLKGAWNFDETSGTSAFDTSGNANTGTASGTPVGPTITSGKFGNARFFNGVTQRVSCGNAPSCNFTNSNFSTEAWIRPLTNILQQVIGRNSGVPLWASTLNANNAFYSRFYPASGSDLNTTAGAGIGTGVWTHVVVTYNRTGNMTPYVNGAVRGVAVAISSVSDLSMFSGNALCIGASSAGIPGNVFNGEIDEVKVYGAALSTDEISDLYNNYGYATTNYPGRVLVRKYATPEPSASLGAEKRFNRGTIFSTY